MLCAVMREVSHDPATNSLCESLNCLCLSFPVYIMERAGKSSQRALCPQDSEFAWHRNYFQPGYALSWGLEEPVRERIGSTSNTLGKCAGMSLY